MKIDIRDFFENYEDTEIELQSDGDFDAEKIIRMTRRELRKKTLRPFYNQFIHVKPPVGNSACIRKQR